MSDSASERDERVPLSRKRGRQCNEWRSSVAKRKRNRGEAYISCVTGRQVAARRVGQPCRDGCFDKITMPVLNEIHRQFWATGDFDLQNSYIQKNVVVSPVKRRRSVQDPEAHRRRSFSRTYYLTHEDESFKVCQKGFLSVLGISETRLRTALKSVSSTGCLRGDPRNRQPSRRILPEVDQRVIQHIVSFPTVSSHYTRAKSPFMRDLDTQLIVKKMYRQYLQWMEEQYSEETRVKLSYYRNKFKSVRLGFKPGAPMSDTSSRCDTLRVAMKATPDQVPGLKEQKKAHLKAAKEGQPLMKRLAKDEDSTKCDLDRENVKSDVWCADSNCNNTGLLERLNITVTPLRKELLFICYSCCTVFTNYTEAKTNFHYREQEALKLLTEPITEGKEQQGQLPFVPYLKRKYMSRPPSSPSSPASPSPAKVPKLVDNGVLGGNGKVKEEGIGKDGLGDDLECSEGVRRRAVELLEKGCYSSSLSELWGASREFRDGCLSFLSLLIMKETSDILQQDTLFTRTLNSTAFQEVSWGHTMKVLSSAAPATLCLLLALLGVDANNESKEAVEAQHSMVGCLLSMALYKRFRRRANFLPALHSLYLHTTHTPARI
ncbi:hypothetical protein E2C01_015425 [Portunus trituberculatus]|uniref:Uncharacterized protein n=1 Tax=Portunus trituberculatus TaxID=210409 RepID=A0A5B7DLL9_PORTR|nr:hypothetical protein [Portunus trituberculatus]